MPIFIQRLLCKRLHLSNPEVLQLLSSGVVMINGNKAQPNQTVYKTDEVKYQDQILQEAKCYTYIAMYKPRGIECTSNTSIPDNLISILPEDYKKLYTVGRLDKDTEGLLLLTDDKRFYEAIADSESYCEKEYRVTVTQPLTEEALQTMREGMIILGKKTRPCKVEKVEENIFHITLTQGLNRQIRRMCYKLKYDILELKRIRIGKITIKGLSDVERYKPLTFSEMDHYIGSFSNHKITVQVGTLTTETGCDSKSFPCK